MSIMIGFGALALVSTVFGMMMAVASDIPQIENEQQYKHELANSTLYDDHWRPIGLFAPPNNVVIDKYGDISQSMQDAIVSIEDKRFWSNPGVDIRGIARAFIADVAGQSRQGASTIAQQFVKNALSEQGNRTVFEKLREAALAYHLTREWKKSKILTEYLNSIYFGNGAYGIEAAAETYFGHDVNHLGCGTPAHELCVEQLQPWEAALLAGIIQSPTAYDPANHPMAARTRRDIVLRQMLEQGYLTRPVYEESLKQALPAPKEVQAPHEQTVEGVQAGYFTSWVQQQIIERYGAPRAFDGGLKIKTTLDLGLQRAAEGAVGSYLANPSGPTASLVAIENSTGEVRAMVGGRDYNSTPFNLATEGERQPGSSFKAFDLAAALEAGISPGSVWTSKQKEFIVPATGGKERFVVHNDEGAYSGSTH
jgi:penicillin-binding protein 1A